MQTSRIYSDQLKHSLIRSKNSRLNKTFTLAIFRAFFSVFSSRRGFRSEEFRERYVGSKLTRIRSFLMQIPSRTLFAQTLVYLKTRTRVSRGSTDSLPRERVLSEDLVLPFVSRVQNYGGEIRRDLAVSIFSPTCRIELRKRSTGFRKRESFKL